MNGKKGRPTITEENILNNEKYVQILGILQFALSKGKKVKLKHLRYALVKNHGAKQGLSDKKKKEFETFFELDESEKKTHRYWDSEKNKPLVFKIKTYVDELRVSYPNFEKNRLRNSEGLLDPYLNKLQRLGMVKKEQGRFYRPTIKGLNIFMKHTLFNDILEIDSLETLLLLERCILQPDKINKLIEDVDYCDKDSC